MAKPEKKKKVSGKEHDSSKYIDTEPTLDEAAKGTAVVAWGRMNPMTAGHEKLVAKVASVAKSEKGMPHIFLTHSFDAKKNPLSYETKIKYAQKAFGPIVKKSNAKTIFQLMKQLETRFNRVVLVAGSDRVKEFNDTLNKYNGKEYKFDEIKVVSAGQRDEEADDVSGISGTKMRGYAVTDMKKFAANLPKRIQGDAEEIAALVRKGMNMSEENELLDGEQLDEVLTRQQRRRRAMLMKRMKHKIKRGQDKAKRRTASMAVLKRRARKKAIMALKQRFAKHRRFADLSSGEKETIEKRVSKFSKKRIDQMARKLLPKVKAAERARRKNMAKTKLKEDLDLNTKFESFLNEGLWGEYNTKRPHQLMDEKGRVKFDKRFKMYRSKNEVNEDLQWEDLMDLVESTEAFAEDYYKGVAQDKKDDRKAHFKKYAEKPGDGADKDSNYKDAPGDIGKDGKRVKTKLSKHTKNYRKMYGEDVNEWVCGQCNCEPCTCEGDGLQEDATASLKKKAEKTGMPLSVLRQVYNRGVAAWKSGHRPGTTPEQWGHARVNSFVTKSSGTWGKADADLAAKVRKEETELDEAKRGASTMNRLRDMQDKSNAMAAKPKPKKKLKDMRKADKSWGKSRAFDYHEEVELDEASFSADVTSEPGPLRRYVNTALKKGLKTKVVRHGGATEVILTGDRDVITKFLKSQKFSAKEIARGFDKMKESVELDEGILKPYHAAAKQPWSKTVKDSKGTVGEYKQIGKGKDFTVHTAYRGSNKSQPHYVVRDDKIIGSGMTFNSALKDAKLKDKDVTHRSKFADGSILNKGMKESREDELAHHSAGLKDAEERISRAGSTEEMIKAMNKKSHHARALSKLHRMEDVNNKFEAFLESKDMDELNLSFKDVTKTGNKSVFKAMKADKTKSDLADLRAKLAKYGKPKVKNEESMEDLAHVANKAKVEKEKKDSKGIEAMKKAGNAKSDAEAKERKSIMDEEGGAGDEGTDKLVKKFKKDTPNCSD